MKKIRIETVCKKMLADVYTPVGIYLRLRDRFRDTVLLESTDHHAAENSWSFMGVQAIGGIEVKDLHMLEFKYPGEQPVKQAITDSKTIPNAINAYLQRYETSGDESIPAAQSLFGYTSYDAVNFFENLTPGPSPRSGVERGAAGVTGFTGATGGLTNSDGSNSHPVSSIDQETSPPAPLHATGVERGASVQPVVLYSSAEDEEDLPVMEESLVKYNVYTTKQYELARAMRHSQTEAEAALWNVLRNNQLGVKFRRQHPVDAYIVDFICLPKALIVEVDGEYHNDAEQIKYDTERTQLLKRIGFSILRFTNEEVLDNPYQIAKTIRQKMNATKAGTSLTKEKNESSTEAPPLHVADVERGPGGEVFSPNNPTANQQQSRTEAPLSSPKAGEGPGVRYRLYQYVIAINHFKDELYICENKVAGLESELAVVESLIRSRNVPEYPFATNGVETGNMTDEAYKEMVEKGKGACRRGDVFQIVLSRRYQQPFTGDEFNVYRALRSVNPSPYLFYFDYGDYRLFGSSPESQLVIRNGKAIVHPIAGTFKRTGDDAQDEILAENLLADPKENAEHVMLVDLARNDMSRHAQNVTVSSYRKVHYYSHVIHLVSEVTGQVPNTENPFEVFAATFPAGTLSGAPKVKAMQLINQWEPTPRGYYGGAIGLLGLDGSFNHAIMIRTFLSRNNTLFYQAGAGVTVNSVAENELQEVTNKLGALKKAIVLAEEISS